MKNFNMHIFTFCYAPINDSTLGIFLDVALLVFFSVFRNVAFDIFGHMSLIPSLGMRKAMLPTTHNPAVKIDEKKKAAFSVSVIIKLGPEC